MKRYKRILSVLTAAALMLGLCAPASAAGIQLRSSNDMMDQDNKVPSGYVANQNPYGYPTDVAFNLNPTKELLFYGGADKGKHAGLEDTNGKSLKDFVKNPKSATESRDYNIPDGTWSFVQAAAFDPSGSGRDDHAVFIGVKDKHAKVWVSGLGGSKTVSSVYDLGEITWMNNGYNQFQSTSLFDIVAGDFDGDGKDTVVVYVPNSGDDFMLTELSYDASKKTIGQKAESKGLLMNAYFTSSINRGNDDSANKLAVSMTVSDLNGDKIDDLAVLSYCHRVGTSDVSLDCYRPTIKVVYGANQAGTVVDKAGKSVANVWYSDNGTHTFPAAASLVSGDFNGDTVDDLFVVGARATAGMKDNGTKVNGKITVYDKYWYMQGIFTSVNSKGGVSLVSGSPYYVDTNGWWVGGFYSSDDSCWGEVMAEAVAFGGMGAREMLFVAGRIYDVGGGNPKEPVHNVGYFNSSDDGATSGATSSIITNTHVQSVTAGNFDGNEYGREQVVFTIGLKEKGHDDYYYMCVYIAGKYNDRNELIGYENIDVQDDSSYIYANKGDDLDEGLACLVLGVDYDKDGDVVKYLGSDYIYADPEVKAVIQAAPYFEELTDSSYNETSYTLETTYGVSDGSISEFNQNGGIAVNATAYIVSEEFSLSYTHEMTSTTLRESATTYSNTYTAYGRDVVVVHRTPFTVHKFHAQKSDGSWPAKSEKPDRTCLIPLEPYSANLTVEEYNDFVKDYNKTIEDAIQAKKVSGDWNPLVELDPEENYLADNEGNPWAYNTLGHTAVPVQSPAGYSANAQVLSTERHSMDTSGGAKTVRWSQSNTTTDSEEEVHGLSFAFTVTAGKYFGGATGGAGVTGGLDTAAGSIHSTTEGTLVGTSCTVKDIDKKELVNSGQRGEVIDQYGFQWSILGWERHLCGNADPKADLDGDGDADGITMTPVIGYYLTDIRSPSLSVRDLKAAAAGDTVTLTWTTPDQHGYWPDVSGYKVYEVVGSTYTRVSEAVITDTGDCVAAVIVGCAPSSTHSYVVTTYDKNGNESIWSNQVTVTMPVVSYTLTYAAEQEGTAALTAYRYGATSETYTSGGKIPAETTVTVKAAPGTGYVISGFEVVRGGEPAPFMESGDSTGARYCTFPMAADTTVTVLTKECQSDLTATFTDVNPNLWYFDGVDYTLANGLMNGVSSDLFAPDRTTTRGMIVTILHRLESELPAEPASFGDVVGNAWYTNAVAWAAENGIVNGYSAERFGPMEPITREQMAAILYRYAQYRGIDVRAGEEGDLLAFVDAEDVSKYAVSAMQWAVEENLINGVEESVLAPDGTASRAQIATILMRFCEGFLR